MEEGDYLKDIILKRKNELGLTTEDLSLKSNVPAGTINKILNGETPTQYYYTAASYYGLYHGF